ncbi:BMC domain-containing protein [Halodesulfovibrio marinisediminis]|uniref:BMC domain-containing protein n=1 Tax=Halodesulfovibrio marinisediminis DSM 17456 TaxID=1121457 RepID=A0A1N6GYK9_9BACT|nr:BMC domain-containing protein [Halodesulfovibrio marinisediminis]SIO12576.1 BMC domain-containing protein [Halodesulfovibrio marinisediminis DSM 17456]
MKSLGLIETKGLLPAIECADVMLKAADVRLLGRTCIGAGLVSVSITGDVAAVKAAVDAAKAAVQQLDPNALYSSHVIPRPDEDVFDGMFSSALIGTSKEQKHDIEPDSVEQKTTEKTIAEPEAVKLKPATPVVEAVEAESVVEGSIDGEQKTIASVDGDSIGSEVGSLTSTKGETQRAKQSEEKLSQVESLNADSTELEKDSDKATPELPSTSKVVTTPAVAEKKAEDAGKHPYGGSEPVKTALSSAGQTFPASKSKKASAKSKVVIMHKKNMDALWAEQGAEGISDGLIKLTLAKLRVLAREYPDLPIESKKLSKVKKRTLVEVFKRYYALLEK